MSPRAAAKRYARALFDVVLKEGADVEAVHRQLDEFVSLLASHEALGRALSNPAVPVTKKHAVVQQLVDHAAASGEAIAPQLAKLLLLLAGRDRLTLLSDIAAAYQDRLMDHQKVVRAEVVTAVPLGAGRAKLLEEGLARATGRKVQLETRVDPSIVGGAITRIGSTVYDGSITTQLEKLKERLVEAEA